MPMPNRLPARAFPTRPHHDMLGVFIWCHFGVGGVAIYDLRRIHVSVQYIFSVAEKWVSGRLDAALSAR
jgi:hypothetical protein